MIVDPGYAERSKTVYAELAARASVLEIPVWHCDPSGRVLVAARLCPQLQQWFRRDGIEQAFQKGIEQLCRSDPSPVEFRAGCWLIPLEDRHRAQRNAMNVGLVFTEDAPDVPRELARRSHVAMDRLMKLLRQMLADLLRAEQDARTIDQFSEKLAQAYEETNLLYRMARLLNSVNDPFLSVSAIGSQLQQVMPFGWLAIYFSRNARSVAELSGKLVLCGSCACPEESLAARAAAIIENQITDDWMKILNPRNDALARAVGAEVLVEPITHNNRPVGLLMAGNKLGPDPELSSFETQFLDATADFLGVFHANLARFAEQEAMFLGTLRALTAAIDAKDRYTRGHSERVALLASKMATAMGLDRQTVEYYRIAGIVHDVGKIGVPEGVLCKPGRLTDEEYQQIRLHPGIGYHILQGIPNLDPVLPGVLSHHERWDGRGYPNGQAGEDIPLIARVLALADTFDAMSSTRAYRPALPRARVLDELAGCAGTQFDPQLVPIFVSLDFSDFEATLESHRQAESRAA